MQAKKIVIVGGNGAGLSAAGRLIRKSKEKLHVIVFEKSDVVSYGACGLPYYVGGFNDDESLLIQRTAKQFVAQGIDLRIKHEITQIDVQNKIVKGQNESGAFEEKADIIIMAMGAKPVIPNIPGTNLKNVHVLRTIQDANAIKDALLNENIKNICIIGGGYIGVEIAEACYKQNKSVRVIEASGQIANGFDIQFAKQLQNTLEKHSISVLTNKFVTSIEGEETVECVKCGTEIYKADLVIIAVGLKPNTEIIKGDIEKFANNAILTDVHMRTSVEDVYAVGDCSSVMNKVTKKPSYIPLGTNANKQGRFVADSILGLKNSFEGVLGTSMLKCLDYELAKTGLSLNEALQNGINAKEKSIIAYTHSRYYPGAQEIVIQICYEEGTKRILGAQLGGKEDSAWRIDVFACAIDQNMTAPELGALDLGYAPPFSSVWDAINRAANAI